MTIKKISLTRGFVTIVDEEDYEALMKWNWHIGHGKWAKYARRSSTKDKNKIYELMHRAILNAPSNFQVDHINGDTLDNRRCNLRLCTSSENAKNRRKMTKASSKYKGVNWHKSTQSWQVRIRVSKKLIHLGIWNNEIEAAKIYDKAAIKYFGRFAKINFPEFLSVHQDNA